MLKMKVCTCVVVLVGTSGVDACVAVLVVDWLREGLGAGTGWTGHADAVLGGALDDGTSFSSIFT